MIGYVKGVITHVKEDAVFVDVHGVGYRVYMTEAALREVHEGKEATLFTYLNVREDALQLYGFLTEEEYDLFLLLISVSGIGPKVGMGMLSGMLPEDIRFAIASENVAVLVKLPGVGKKTAERLVLELKDKIGAVAVPKKRDKVTPETLWQAPKGPVAEVIMALESLGYRADEVKDTVEALAETEQDVTKLLKSALGVMGKRR